MPNWTTNYLYVEGTPEVVAVVKSAYKPDPSAGGSTDFLDFEDLLPMPAALKGTRSPARIVETQEEADEINSQQKATLGRDEPGVITRDEAYALYAAHGANNWYDWSVNNWGTKWNSDAAEVLYSDDTRFVVRFETAWSEPSGIISHLRSMEGLTAVEHVSLHEGGEDPTMSEGWERFFEVDTEEHVEDMGDGETYTYTHTHVSYSPDADVAPKEQSTQV